MIRLPFSIRKGEGGKPRARARASETRFNRDQHSTQTCTLGRVLLRFWLLTLYSRTLASYLGTETMSQKKSKIKEENDIKSQTRFRRYAGTGTGNPADGWCGALLWTALVGW